MATAGLSDWGVVQVIPGWDERVTDAFDKIGVDSLKLLMEVRRVMRGRRFIDQVLLFPSYVVARIATTWQDNAAAIRTSRGVLRVLMSGDTPARLEQHFVDHFSANPIVRFEFTPKFYRGQAVRTTADLYSDHLLPGEFVGLTSETRCRVLFMMFGRASLVELDLDQVEAV